MKLEIQAARGHGSLNLLSHTGSRDLMMRLTDSSVCDRVRRLLEHARETSPPDIPPT